MKPTRTRSFARTLSLLAAGVLALAPAGRSLNAGVAVAGPDKNVTQDVTGEPTAIDLYSTEFSYVSGNGGFQRHYGHLGSQDEFEDDFQYSHRFLIKDKLYLRLGAEYNRFDFGSTRAPVPNSLQSIDGVVALEYVVENRPGIFIESNPGIYYTNIHAVNAGNFDAPTTIGGVIPATKKLYFVAGAHISLLSRLPVFPFAGVVWLIRDNLRIEAVPPEPRMIYTVNEKLDLFLGGELIENAYKQNQTNNNYPKSLDYTNSAIDYSEYRVGTGVTYSPTKQIDIDLSGGYEITRDFNYYRGAGREYINRDGSAYAKIAIKAEF